MQPPPLANSAAPLAWVAQEIRAALTVAQGVVRAAAAADGVDAAALRSARQQLHEAGGALHLIDLRGPALLVNGIEQVLNRWEVERPADMAVAAGTLDNVLTALAAYLDRAANGAVEAPLRLFSYYRDVLELAGSGRAQPSDLLFPDLSRRPQLPPPPAPPPAAELRRRRSAFEQALLALFRNGADAAAAQAVATQLSGLEGAAQRGLARSFWWVVTGLAQAVGAGSIAVDDDLKRLLARINLQLRRLIGGDESVAERLLVDALYYVGRAGDRLPRTAEIRALYDLAELLPADFEKPTLTAFDPALVHSLTQSLTQAKSEWAEVFAGQREPRAFAAAVELVRRDAQRLPAPPLVPICDALTVIARKLPRLPPSVRETLGVEVASALLFVELGADAPHRLDHAYAERARTVLARLQAAANEKPLPEFNAWMLDLAREASDRLALGAVLAETRSALAGLEQTLDRYFRDPAAHRDELAPLDAQLAQIYGVLLTLGHDEPAAALHSVRGAVRALAEGTTAPDPAEFARIAGNLGALGFFVGMMVPGQPPPAGVFHYDADRAVLSASLARPAPAFDRDSVEADLRAQVLAVQSAVAALEAAPQDNAADERLQQALTRLAATAELLDDAGLRQRVTEAQARHTEFLATGTEVGAVAAALAPLRVAAPSAAATAVPSGPAVDRELFDTFLQEAEQVLDELDGALAELAQAPDDRAALTQVRRAFHTLKGASRMVRLDSFGEAAWHLEQCCNLWLAQERPATVGLLGLAADAVAAMRGWLPAVAADPTVSLPVEPLLAQAQRVREDDADAEPAPLPPAVEEVELLPLPEEEPTPAEDTAAVETRRIGPVEISHALYTVFINEADEHLRQLIQDIGEWRYEPRRRPAETSVRAAHSLVGVARTVGLAQVAAVAAPIEGLLRELSPSAEAEAMAVPADVALTPPQFDVLERGLERLRAMLHEFAAGMFPDPAPLEAAALEELGTVVATQAQLQGAQTVKVALERALAPAMEASDAATPAATVEAAAPGLDAAIESVPPPVEPVALVALVVPAEVGEMPLPDVLSAPPAPAAAAPESLPAVGVAAAASLLDEFDPELLEVFLAESHELLPAIGADLRALGGDEASAQAAAASLRRNLHTLKGAARMAGAMQLGEVLHEMETRVGEAESTGELGLAVDELLGRLDQAQGMAERLQGRSVPVADSAAPSTAAAAVGAAPVAPAPAPAPALFGAAAGEGAAGGTVVRVRADVLDRLVDQAGEVAIARSKLESEIGTLKGALTDLNDNIGRLRSQLREVEIQADAQIQARSDQVARHSADFDPLEFDRYTRLQELTRLLAESVEDAALIQNNLLKGLVTADTDLTTQSRLTRELQQQLMRVRLVPFTEIAERMHRLVRRTAKEVGKRVNLDLHGGSTEVDRGVLEKMTGAFEHLVRNAIVHGIESAAERAAAGKPVIGQIEMTVRLQGGEVVVALADDGAGLDLPRIEALARARGLLKADARPTERELIELIFLPGFSTADTVTELAGRGVGMDVVRAELAAVGGRIAAVSERGRGTRFTLHLPATLSLARVVLARTGAVRYAIPAPIVEQVRRVRAPQVPALLAAGEMDFAPVGKVPLRALAQLVGAEAHAQAAAQVPVVLLRAGDDRLAIVADDVSSAQEVVVKNVGPQVARLAGMIGATILGDGEVVLIVDPVQLLARAPQAAVPALVAPAAEPLAPLVMVVDDSLTVRRVSQRLLERAGYRVALAKDGVDGLRQLQDVVPDAILLDIEMPRMDGFDFARNVRSDARTRAVPIIVVTSRAADKHRGHALEAGANHFLGKPFDEDELLALLARYVGERTPA